MIESVSVAGIPCALRKLLEEGRISFREYVERCLYDPEFGYYTRRPDERWRHADYMTAPAVSPVFGWALGNLVREFVEKACDTRSTIVDIGCGDGTLLRAVAERCGEGPRYIGIDRSLSFVEPRGDIEFGTTLDVIPRDACTLVVSNELFDALPYTRLVRREDGLHELGIELRGDALEWCEWPADESWQRYFDDHGIELLAGQFADVSRRWAGLYGNICERVNRGLIVTFDYGFKSRQLFDPRIRKFGTAAAYAKHEVHRDLLASPGRQDLTAHVNFEDLVRTGESAGFSTLLFSRQAAFLLSIGVLDHPLFAPLEEVSLAEGLSRQVERENARRLVLPDGIGDEIRVLVQAKGLEGITWNLERSMMDTSK